LVFQRGNELLRIETTRDKDGTFGLTVYGADGKQVFETFTSQVLYENRLEALERQLLADHWTPRGPALLPRTTDRKPH
jgi:hypothetical protein